MIKLNILKPKEKSGLYINNCWCALSFVEIKNNEVQPSLICVDNKTPVLFLKKEYIEFNPKEKKEPNLQNDFDHTDKMLPALRAWHSATGYRYTLRSPYGMGRTELLRTDNQIGLILLWLFALLGVAALYLIIPSDVATPSSILATVASAGGWCVSILLFIGRVATGNYFSIFYIISNAKIGFNDYSKVWRCEKGGKIPGNLFLAVDKTIWISDVDLKYFKRAS